MKNSVCGQVWTKLVRPTAKRVIPDAYYPEKYVHRMALRRTKCRVSGGPFRGMRYLPTSAGSVLAPKLLGTYEQECHEVIERAIRFRPEMVINIGAGEGYYTVGCAMRLPNASVVAFEECEARRELMGSLAELNQVEGRIAIRGRCDSYALGKVLRESTGEVLMICDTEGAEDDLIKPDLVPGLRRAFLLIEIHEKWRPGVEVRLRARLSSSHRIQRIPTETRRWGDSSIQTWYTRLMPGWVAARGLTERRPTAMSWFWCEPFTTR